MEKPIIELSQPILLFKQVWLNEIVITLLATLVIFVASFLMLHYLQKRHQALMADATHHPQEAKPFFGIWGWGFFEALSGPLFVAIWVVGIIFCLEVLDEQYPHVKIIETLQSVRSLILILVLFWFLQRFVTYTSQFALEMKRKHNLDVTMVHALIKIGRLFNWVILILAALEEFGVPLSGVVAFGGGSALIVGIAAKDLLANFFGGWVIIMDKPFKVGDWIASPDQEIEGTVEYIGWRSTRILNFERRPLYVPNSVFTNITISNPSRMKNRRIRQTVGLRYDDAKKVAAISSAIEVMLKQHPDIDQRQTIFVSLVNFAESSLNLLVYAFTKSTNWLEFQRAQEDVMLKILEIIEANQAQTAFPTRTLARMPEDLLLNHVNTKDV